MVDICFCIQISFFMFYLQSWYLQKPALLCSLRNQEKMEKYVITGQHNYHRASIHLAMYGLYVYMVYLLLYIDQFFYVLPPVLLLVIGGSVVFAKKMRKKLKNRQLQGNIIIIGLQYIQPCIVYMICKIEPQYIRTFVNSILILIDNSC